MKPPVTTGLGDWGRPMFSRALQTIFVVLFTASAWTMAQAETVLYGNINISLDTFDIEHADNDRRFVDGHPAVGDDTRLNSNTSSIGIKGSEDLGNGLKVIYQAEFQFDPTEGTGFSGRDQWVGMAGGWGKMRVGTISTSYKSHGAMIDPIYRTSLQNRNFGVQSNLHKGKGDEGQGRATNTVRYDSPSFFGGLGFIGTFTRQTDNGKDNKTDNPFSVGAHYKFGSSALIFADYITNDQDGDNDAWKVGGKWLIGNFGIYGQFEKDNGLISSEKDNEEKNDLEGADVWMLGASYNLGNFLFYGSYAQGSDNSDGDGEYRTWQVVTDYRFSKRTDVYGGYSNVDCDNPGRPYCTYQTEKAGETKFWSIGMRHKF